MHEQSHNCKKPQCTKEKERKKHVHIHEHTWTSQILNFYTHNSLMTFIVNSKKNTHAQMLFLQQITA